MALMLKVGQELRGVLDTYTVSRRLRDDIWLATTCTKPSHAIIKTAPPQRLANEKNILKHFQGQPCVRRLLDHVEVPPSLILNYMDGTVLDASDTKTLETNDIKHVARKVLMALEALHSQHYVHTDIKPDNILVNNDGEGGVARIKDVELSDFGDTCRIDPKEHMKPGVSGEPIGAPIFRSPEALLSLRWGAPTDIWSFGTTIISLILGSSLHMFMPDPKLFDISHPEYVFQVLIQQIAWFGPIPETYTDLLPDDEDDRWVVLGEAVSRICRDNAWKPFMAAQDIADADKKFLSKIMKLDPRDRPTAEELLKDEWFHST